MSNTDINGKEIPAPIAPKVSMQTKLSYGFGSFGKDFSLCVVNTFLFFYLTDVAKVPATIAGVIFLVARVWDTINDFLFALIVTKVNTRWGKYKPWLIAGNFLQCFFLAACFCTHMFEGTTQIVYLAVVYICWGMSYTICDAPFWSLVPCITLDKHEREGLLPYPRFAATIGNYLAAGLGVYAVALFGQGDDGFGYAVYGLIAGLLAIASALVTCKWTEQNYAPAEGETFKLSDAFTIITKNKQFIFFIVIALCFVIGTGVSQSLNLYIYKYCLHDASLFSVMQLWAGLVTIPSIVFFTVLVRIFSRKLIFALALILPLLYSGVIAMAGWGMLPVYPSVVASGIIFGFSNSIYWILVFIMVADCVDFGDYRLGLRSEIIYYSLHTLVIKCSGAIASAFLGVYLSWINYLPDQEQTQETIDSMLSFYFGATLICVVSLVVYLTVYHLNGDTLDKIQREITRRKMEKLTADAVAQEPSAMEKQLLDAAKNQ